MSKRLGGRLVTLTTMAFAGLAIAAGQATAAGPSDAEALQMYEATVNAEQFAELQTERLRRRRSRSRSPAASRSTWC